MARTGKKSPEASEPAAAPAAGDSAAATKAKADAPLSNAEKASPVLTAIGKRLRAARKRLGKIKAIEDIQGDKELNADQVLHRLQRVAFAAVISGWCARDSRHALKCASPLLCGGCGGLGTSSSSEGHIELLRADEHIMTPYLIDQRIHVSFVCRRIQVCTSQRVDVSSL